MATESVVAVYDSVDRAEEAVCRLDEVGIPVGQISLAAQNMEGEQVHGFVSAAGGAKTGAEMGAWVGGLFGLLVGAIFVWIPGFGPLLAAGPLAAVLADGAAGFAAGAAGGGLLGALTHWGVPETHLFGYTDKLQAGKLLVVVHGTAEEVEKAEAALAHSHAEEIHRHAEEDA